MGQVLTRRAILRGAASAAVGALLAACSSGQATDTPAPATPPTVAPSVTPTFVPLRGTSPPTPPGAAVSGVVPTPFSVPTIVPTAPTAMMPPTASTAIAAGSAPASTAPAGMPTRLPVATTAPVVGGFPTAMGQSGSLSNIAVPGDLKGRLSVLRLTVALPFAADGAKALADNADLLAYLRQALGIEVTGVVPPTAPAQLDLLRAKSVDLAFLAPITYIAARDEKFVQSVVQGERPDGKPAISAGLLIGITENGLLSPVELRGKRVAFVDADPLFGQIVPAHLLQTHPQLTEGKDYTVRRVATFEEAYQLVLMRQVEAAAFPALLYTPDRGVDVGKVKILDQSEEYPGGIVAARLDLPAADVDTLVALFLTLNEQPRDAKLYQNTVLSPPRGKGSFGGDTVKLRRAPDSAYDLLRKVPQELSTDAKALVR